MAHHRITFRSDTRPPRQLRLGLVFNTQTHTWQNIGQVGNIFASGFRHHTPLLPGQTAASAYRPRPSVAGDMGAGVVCLSQRLSGAALFPFGNHPIQDADGARKPANTGNTWIYTVLLQEGQYYSTHNRQILDGWDCAQYIDPSQGWWPIYAHEIATTEVQAVQVVAAVKCDRSAHTHYKLIGPIDWNEHCRTSQEYKKAIENFLNGEIAAGVQARALRSSGYTRARCTDCDNTVDCPYCSKCIVHCQGCKSLMRDWKTKTSRIGHWRSGDLKKVDNAIEAYERTNAVRDRDLLRQAFQNWYSSNPKERSSRNVDGIVENLKRCLGA
jgi:hypothetical protein